jgi:long-chain fatty acid transport protein
MSTARRRVCLFLILGAAGFLGAVPAAAQTFLEGSLFSGSLGSGARALGMGGAFIAVADDATASSWNPAGLCVLDRPEASVVVVPRISLSRNFPALTFTSTNQGVNPATVDRSTYTSRTTHGASRTLDFASVTYPVRAGTVKLVPQLSYQRLVDLGFDLDFAYTRSYSRTAGAPAAPYQDQFESVTTGGGGIDVLGGSLGVSPSSKVYLGIAVNLLRNGGDSNRTDTAVATGGLNRTLVTETVEAVTFKGMGWNVGALVKPRSNVALGVVFKNGFDVDHTRENTRTVTTTPSAGSATNTFTTRNETGTIRWPRTIAAGVAVMPQDTLTVSVDFTQTSWSKAEYTYEGSASSGGTGRSTSTSGLAPTVVIWPTYYSPGLQESSVNPAQPDTRQWRFGVEKVLKNPGAGLTALPIRVGIYTDQQFEKNRVTLEPVTNFGLTLGAGLVWKNVTLDTAFVHNRGSNDIDTDSVSGSFRSQSDYDGEFTERTNRILLSTTVRF